MKRRVRSTSRILIVIIMVSICVSSLYGAEKKDLEKAKRAIAEALKKINMRIAKIELKEGKLEITRGTVNPAVKEKMELIRKKGLLEAARQELDVYLSNMKDEINAKIQNFVSYGLANYLESFDRDKKTDYYAGIEYSFLDSMVLDGSGLIPRQGLPLLRFGFGQIDAFRLEIRYPLSRVACDVEEGPAISWDHGDNSFEQLSYNWGSFNMKYIRQITNDIMPYIHLGFHLSDFIADEQNRFGMFGASYGVGIDMRLFKYFMFEFNYTGTYQRFDGGSSDGERLAPNTNEMFLISHSLNVGLFLSVQFSTEKVDKFFNVGNR